ncbi:hypothetical protein TRVA0_025S00936 [Trichomonascus vanleenenianus]|uniref:uncharacterized protein n=1 Tax=Trichomonascus vanleenenianus TaxID=2268995 RepID=UPI003ECAC162
MGIFSSLRKKKDQSGKNTDQATTQGKTTVDTATTQAKTALNKAADKPAATQPISSEPISAKSPIASPVSTQPGSTQPASTQPVSSQPISSQPPITEPAKGPAERNSATTTNPANGTTAIANSTTKTTNTQKDNMAKVAIIYYSTWGHIRKLAVTAKEAIESAGGSADLYQIEETLPKEVLEKMHAAPKSDDPIATIETLSSYDAFLFGIPTRYGNMPAQWKAFWDRTGGIWVQGTLSGKYAGIFTSTGSPNSGAEATVMNSLSTLAHHGVIFVPLGYAHCREQIANLTEPHGGSPWGAGTFAAPDGSRQPTKLELEIVAAQGKAFLETVSRVNF